MKNRRGFTLVEMIFVIVVLCLVATASVSIFINIRKSILEKEYNNVVSYLETKAIEYANKTNITTINVEDLINQGLVKPDNQTDILNPITKESLNCNIIRSSFDGSEFKAVLGEKLVDENNSCKKPDKTSIFEICRVENGKCLSIDSYEWFNHDLVLGIKYSNDKENKLLADENIKIHWVSTNGFASDEKTIETSTSSVSQNTYRVEVDLNDIVGETSKKVNIDKQQPNVYDILYDHNWSANKSISLKASDMSGSGIDGYSLVSEKEECNSFSKSNTFNITVNGSYKYCVKDKAGNITSDMVVIDKIDGVIPDKPNIVSDDKIESDKWHINDFILTFESKKENNTSKIEYFYGWDKDNLIFLGDSININSDYSRKTLYVKACNEANLCSDINNYIVKIDNIAPIYEMGGYLGAGNISTPTYKDNEGGSGEVKVYTCVSSSTNINSLGDCFSNSTNYNYSCGVTYRLYSYAVDAVGNKSEINDHTLLNNVSYYKRCSSGGSYTPPTPDPEPEKPTTPTKPTKPTKPTTPTKPTKPTTPTKPQKPDSSKKGNNTKPNNGSKNNKKDNSKKGSNVLDIHCGGTFCGNFSYNPDNKKNDSKKQNTNSGSGKSTSGKTNNNSKSKSENKSSNKNNKNNNSSSKNNKNNSSKNNKNNNSKNNKNNKNSGNKSGSSQTNRRGHR